MAEDIGKNYCLFSPAAWMPTADVYEKKEEILVVVDLAGVERDQLEVTLDGRTIQIAGRRKIPCPSGYVRIRQMEIDTGEFRRQVALPGPVDFDKIECVYKDGFLHIVLPKKRQGDVIQIQIEVE
jgi:HSP20 family protein